MIMKITLYAGAMLFLATAATAQDGMTLKGITLGTDVESETVGLLLDGWVQTDLDNLRAGMTYDLQKKMATERMPIGDPTEGEAWSDPLITYLGFDRGHEALEIVADARGHIQEITYVIDYAADGPFGDYDAAMALMEARYDGPPTCGTSALNVRMLTWILDRDLKQLRNQDDYCTDDGIIEHVDIWSSLGETESKPIAPGIRVVSWLDTHDTGPDTVIDGMSITVQDVDAMMETLAAGFEAISSAHPGTVAPDF